MSTERDELARELFIADNFNQPREQSIVDWQWFMETPRFAVRIERYKAMAEGVISAGYAKPRQITTVEELDALAVGSVISEDDRSGQGHGAIGKEYDGWVCISHATQGLPSEDIMLPANVLWEPQP